MPPKLLSKVELRGLFAFCNFGVMPPAIPSSEPRSAIAGTSWQWDRRFPLFPASDGWSLRYLFRGAGELDLGPAEITAAGDGWQVRVAPELTTGLASGRYGWMAVVEKGGERHVAASGSAHVTAFPSGADGLTHAERMLAAIEALLEGRATSDQESVQINGRAITRIPFGDLVKWRNHYRAQVEMADGGGSPMRSFGVTFGPV